MPVDRASYRGWEGTARPSPRSVLAIAGTMISRRMKLKLVRYLTSASVFGAIMFSAGWFLLTTMFDDNFRALLSTNPGADQLLIANRMVFGRLLFIALVITAVVGAPMIAEDRRAKALRLYFSRPITHLEYVLGKFLAVAAFAVVVLVVPLIAMYVLELGLSDKDGLAAERLPTLLASFGPALLACGVLTMLVLGISSLSARTNHASIGFFAVFGITGMVSQILAGVFRNPTWQAISPWSSLRRVTAQMLPMPELKASRMFQLPVDSTWDVGTAWLSLAVWTGLGLGALFWSMRKVEVVA